MIQTPSPSSGIESRYHLFGSRLKATREALGIDYKEAAAQLRLHDTVILMLESGQFKANLPLLFIRGYLRNYSKFLSIPEPEIKAALELLQPTALSTDEPAHKPVSQTRNAAAKRSEPRRTPSFNLNKGIVLAACVTIFVIASLVSFWVLKPSTSTNTMQLTQPAATTTLATTQPTDRSKPAAQKTAAPRNMIDHPAVSWLSNIISLLLVLILGMRSAPQVTTKMHMGSQASTRPTLMLSATRSPGILRHIFNALKNHQSFAFFSFIIISSVIGVAINWQHKQAKHNPSSQAAYTQPEAAPAIETPFNPDYTPQRLESADFNAVLKTSRKVNALQALVNQLDSYQQTANGLAYTLTDPSTPLGELGAKFKKKSRRNTPAYLNYPTSAPASEPLASEPPPANILE